LRAAVLEAPGRLVVREVPEPEPPPGWALVRSVAVGVCGTDKAFYRGSYPPPGGYPLVPGHEAAGVVAAAPPGYEHLVDRLVVPEINLVDPGDMWREPCRSGLYIHCPAPVKKTLGIDYPGALAEYFAVPAWLLHPVEGLSPEEATAVEPLAAVLKAFALEPPRPGDRAAVVGSGFLASLAAQVLERVYGLEVTVFARRGSPKARLLGERLGLRVEPLEEAEELARREGRWGMGYDLVFEATGSNEGLDTAVRIARPMGVVHVKSTPGGRGCWSQTLAVVKELRLVASRCGTWREFEEAIRLIRSRLVEPLVTSVVWGLERAPEAFERALRREELKVVVRVSRTPWEWRRLRLGEEGGA